MFNSSNLLANSRHRNNHRRKSELVTDDIAGAVAKDADTETGAYRNFNPKRPDCNKIADNLTPDGDLLAETELSSNFYDLKPRRPVNHKAEFKKTRETLATDGEVEYQSESTGHYMDLKPARPKINRIADEMKPEGSFSVETESGNLVDYRPVRPVINRIKDSMAA